MNTKITNGEVENVAASTTELETEDSVFVLSAEEIRQYCSDISAGYTTEHVQEHDWDEDIGYWVRTENWDNSSFQADYCMDGIIYSTEASNVMGVRPAMYILLDS